MKTTTALIALATVLSPLGASAKDANLLANSSFEQNADGRPTGWRAFPTPKEAEGEFFVSAGQEGADTHTGAAALQFRFPEETSLIQAVWMGDPQYAGPAVEPGRYSCSFWVRAEDLDVGNHVWVSLVGYDANKERTEELGRSDYLAAKDFPDEEWTRVRFTFEVPEGVARLGISVVFKTSPDSSANLVPPTTRVLVDDMVIENIATGSPPRRPVGDHGSR